MHVQIGKRSPCTGAAPPAAAPVCTSWPATEAGAQRRGAGNVAHASFVAAFPNAPPAAPASATPPWWRGAPEPSMPARPPDGPVPPRGAAAAPPHRADLAQDPQRPLRGRAEPPPAIYDRRDPRPGPAAVRARFADTCARRGGSGTAPRPTV